MKGSGYRNKMWKKKLCAVLMASLFIESAYLLGEETASPVLAVVGSGSETDFWEETEGSSSENAEPGIPDTETSVSQTQEKNSSEPSISLTDASGQESTGADTLESEGTEPENPETTVSVADRQETDVSESDSLETGVTEPNETKTDIEAEETKNSLEVPEMTSSYTVLPDEKISELEGLTCLQIPEKLEIIIDPWEIDEREQVYSEPFTVKNTGDAPGILTLFFTCTLNRDDRVSIRETEEELHDSEKKLIYMKAMLENGEEYVFTEKGAKFQVKLQQDEELSLWFEGKVNEYAEEPWKDNDIEIKGMYSWEEEETEPKEFKKDSLESEKKADREENLPAETKTETSDAEETLPRETEIETSGAEETLPAEGNPETGTSDVEESLPPESETESTVGEENLSTSTENGTETSSGEETRPIETEETTSGEDETLSAKTDEEDTTEEVLTEETENATGEETVLPAGSGDENPEKQESFDEVK